MKLSHNPILFLLLLFSLTSLPFPSTSDSDRPCRDQCSSIPVHYPFGIDDGCGAPQFRHMFTCNTTSNSLFFITPNGNFKVQSIDYKAQTMTVYDPDMSTCTILQPHHDLVLSDLQYAIIPPSPDTVFALLNCSVDSPLLHHFSSLCFDLPGHRCQDLYSSCNSFRIFTSGIGGPSVSYGTPGAPNNFPLNNSVPGLGNTGYYGAPGVPHNLDLADDGPGLGNTGGQPGYYGAPGAPNNFPINNSPPGGGLGESGPGLGGSGSGGPPGNYYGGPNYNNNPPLSSGTGGGGPSLPPPPCCFTGYSTVRAMRMDILDCTHFTSFYDVDKLKGVEPMEWSYGVKFSYSVPDMGCERCRKSGGSCGFDAETEALMCLCSGSNNSTRQCGTDDSDAAERWTPGTIFQACILGLGVLLLLADTHIFLSIFV